MQDLDRCLLEEEFGRPEEHRGNDADLVHETAVEHPELQQASQLSQPLILVFSQKLLFSAMQF